MNGRLIICIQCERPFLYSHAEQEKFLNFGFDPPRRCPECRARKTRVYQPNGKRKKKGRRRDDGDNKRYSGDRW